jgi:glycosyltransferase involved in cell wall biosynthesis
MTDFERHMRILFVTPFFTPQTGGVATFLEDTRRFLSQRGHEVYVLRAGEARSIQRCPLNSDDRVYESYLRVPWIREAPVRSVVGFALYFFPTLWRLGRFLRAKRIQLVSLEYPTAFMLYFALLRPWVRVKLVAGLHGDDVLSLHKSPAQERAVVKHLIRRADWVLAHSASLMAQAELIVGRLGEKRSYLPYGIDCKRLRQLAAQRQEGAPVPQGTYILTVAKLYERKGIDILLRAIQEATPFLEDHRFLIVGDGPEEARLKQMAVDLGVADRVVFAGEIANDNVPSLFQRCRFFVLPSRSEPFGIVLLEAMTFGKAILATRVGGIPEFVTDGANGVLVPSESPHALAEQLRLLIKRKEHTEQLGKNGLTLVEKVYDYRSMIRRYEELFTRVIADKTSISAHPA